MPDTSRVVDTYTRAADDFDGLPFWHHFGRRTVELVGLAPGAHVVDLCCGTGASAIPAATVVGPTGRVLGVDITPALVDIARRRAARAGLPHATFTVDDVSTFDQPPASADAVISVFGLFFLDDVAGALRRAWRWLTPGGALATTVWGDVVLSPGEAYFWDAVNAEDPTLDHISPAATLATPDALRRVHAEAGLPSPEIVHERWRMPLETPEAFWPVILGTSNRGVFEALTPDAQQRVRHGVIERLRREHVTGLDMAALVALVRRPRAAEAT